MKSKFDDSGLRKLQANLSKLAEPHDVPLTELLSPTFMQSRTDFASFDAMLAASPFEVQSAEDFRAIPDVEWDAFVRKATQFDSWTAMQKEAGVQWVKANLLKGLI